MASWSSRQLRLVALLLVIASGAATAEDRPDPPLFSPRVRVSLDSIDPHSDRRDIPSAIQFGSARVGLLVRPTDWAALLVEYELRNWLNLGGESQLRYGTVLLGRELGPYGMLGQTDEPFSMEAFTSYRNLTFVERALPFALVPLYHTGLVAGTRWKTGGVAIGVFGDTLGQQNHDAGRGWSARAFNSFAVGEAAQVHVGAAVAHRQPSLQQVRYSTRPESAIANVRLIDTNTINRVSNTSSLGVELGARMKSFSLQAEAITTEVHAASTARLHGAYVAAGYVLTGEERRFNASIGAFEGVGKPLHSWGAVELAVRISTLDLDALAGGWQRDTTIGVNYYITDKLRMQVNHIQVRSQRRGVADNPSLLAVRLQADF